MTARSAVIDGAGPESRVILPRETLLARFKQRMGAREVLLGLQHNSASAAIAEIVGHAGFDFLIVDMEHGPYSIESIEGLIRAAELSGLVAFVRVLANDGHLIMQALDAGALGVLVPHIVTRADCEAALSAMRHRPAGTRGTSASRAARWGLSEPNSYEAWTNSETLLIPIIEDREAIANLEEIASLPGLELVAVGPGDLSQSYGEPRTGLRSVQTMAGLERTVEQCEPRGIAVMTIPMPDMSPEFMAHVAGKGARLLWCGSDLSHMARSLRALANEGRRSCAEAMLSAGTTGP